MRPHSAGDRGDDMGERVERPIEILLVEDDPGDVRLTIEALRDAGNSKNLTVARDGLEALAMLRGTPPHYQPAHFDLILMDLNLPK